MTVNHPVPGSSPGGGVNGLEYIRAHISERKKNRNNNPCEREVGSLLMLPLWDAAAVIPTTLVKLVNTPDLKSVERKVLAGSSPASRITHINNHVWDSSHEV